MAVYEKVIRRDVVFLVADGANQANAFIRLDDYVGSSGPHRSCYHRCRVDSLPGIVGGGGCPRIGCPLLHSDRCLLSFTWIHKLSSICRCGM